MRLTKETHEILYPALRAVAKRYGYALAVHGSLERDIDLVAVPWTELAVEPAILVSNFFIVCSVVMTAHWPEAEGNLTNPVLKPHGRLGWVIHMPGTYIDLSVFPPPPRQA